MELQQVPINNELDRSIIYEQPLNERVRIFLRLELLFNKINYHLKGESTLDTRITLDSILELLDLFSRNDLKNDIMKDLEHHAQVLSRLREQPEVDSDRLQFILDKLHPIIENLKGSIGKIGHQAKKNSFLNDLKRRNSIPGGSCAFDLPAFHYWLTRPKRERDDAILTWLEEFRTVEKAVNLTLKLIRESNSPILETATNGFFQKNLESARPCQLLRVALSNDEDFYPEISASRHRFTIRFLFPDFARTLQVEQDIEFHLTYCII